MTRTLRDRTADFLVVLSGPEERVEELQNHFADERAAGRSVTASDVASLLPGVLRSAARHARTDARYWPAGVVLAFIMLSVFANGYPLGWDQVDVDEYPYTAEALRSMRIVDIAFGVGFLASIPAGTRMFQRLKMGRWSIAGVVGTTIAAIAAVAVLSASQPERSFPIFRPQEVNEVPDLLVGSFVLVASLPVMYLVADSLARLWNLRSVSRSTEQVVAR